MGSSLLTCSCAVMYLPDVTLMPSRETCSVKQLPTLNHISKHDVRKSRALKRLSPQLPTLLSSTTTKHAMHRIVITGLGAITPLAVGLRPSWTRLLAQSSALTSIRALDPAFSNLPCTVAAPIPLGPASDGRWNPSDWLSAHEQHGMAPFAQYAVAAAEMALDDAGLLTTPPASPSPSPIGPPRARLAGPESYGSRIGVSIGSGIGNLAGMYSTSLSFAAGGHHKVSPLFVPRLLLNMAAGQVAMRFGLRGPNLAATSACTTGAHAVIQAAQTLALAPAPARSANDHDDEDEAPTEVMLAGGAESCIHPLTLSGFARARSLSPDPLPPTSLSSLSSPTDPSLPPPIPDDARSRPFDARRSGFIVGEGAGILVLETLEHAQRRGARIYAELAGYGMSADAGHVTAPDEQGAGAARAMRAACRMAVELRRREAGKSGAGGLGIGIGGRAEVGYVNAHATGTRRGDLAEVRAIKAWMGDAAARSSGKLAVSSNKGAIGHLLGAAGAVEAIFTVLALEQGVVPGTLNLQDLGEDIEKEVCGAEGEELIDFVRGGNKRVEGGLRAALSNSFGFGGTNASLLFTRYEGR